MARHNCAVIQPQLIVPVDKAQGSLSGQVVEDREHSKIPGHIHVMKNEYTPPPGPFRVEDLRYLSKGSVLHVSGGSVVKNPSANAGEMGLIPGLERSHIL